jgi:amino acid transporter
MAAEVLYIPAKTDDMPRFLARTNGHGAPVSALILAAGLISVLLVALLFAADALDFMLGLTAAPAAALYFEARRERGLRVFSPTEAVLFGVIVLGAVAGVVSLATGAIEI